MAPKSSRNARARSGWSLYRTPTTWSPSVAPSVSSLSLNIGNSSRHGVHHDAQKFTTSGLPRYAARSNALPSSVAPMIGGAGSPVRATGALLPHAATSEGQREDEEDRDPERGVTGRGGPTLR